MITSLKIQNFKSFKEIDLKLGKLNFIIGGNASGKSNFMDALRFLQGIGYGFSFSEILDGKPKSAGTEVWEGIRGGSKFLPFDDHEYTIFSLLESQYNLEFALEYDHENKTVNHEYLRSLDDYIYSTIEADQDSTNQINYKLRTPEGEINVVTTDSRKSILYQISNESGKRFPYLDFIKASQMRFLLSDIQSINPLVDYLRDYSPQQSTRRLGESGENFASLVKVIIKDNQKKEAYLSWLKHLRPEQIEDVKILKGAVGESMFAIVEGGKMFPAPVLSDGTLRFAALAAAMFQPDMPAIMTIEEIESGIHPSRLRLLVELLRNRAEQTDTQFFITTHSPVLLSWLKEEEYQHTFYCKRDDATGESKLTPLSEMPHFSDAIKTSSLGDLVSEGWMEANL